MLDGISLKEDDNLLAIGLHMHPHSVQFGELDSAQAGEHDVETDLICSRGKLHSFYVGQTRTSIGADDLTASHRGLLVLELADYKHC